MSLSSSVMKLLFVMIDCADLGYPRAIQLPNDNILVAYYFTQADGVRHIAGTILDIS